MELTELTAVPVIIALTGFFKQIGLPNRLLPILNLVFGVIAAIIIDMAFVPTTIVKGVIFGLTAAGLYRSTKVTFGGE